MEVKLQSWSPRCAVYTLFRWVIALSLLLKNLNPLCGYISCPNVYSSLYAQYFLKIKSMYVCMFASCLKDQCITFLFASDHKDRASVCASCDVLKINPMHASLYGSDHNDQFSVCFCMRACLHHVLNINPMHTSLYASDH